MVQGEAIMIGKRFHFMAWITILILLGAVACSSSTEGESSMEVEADALPLETESESDSNQAQSSEGGKESGAEAMALQSGPDSTSAQAQGSDVGAEAMALQSETGSVVSLDKSGEVTVVDGTLLSEEELANQPPGQSDPLGADGATPPEAAELDAVYTNAAYKFEVAHPADFVIREQPADKLAQLTPTPVASFTFMNPVLARSQNVELELADLEIRVFNAGPTATLENRIKSIGVVPEDSIRPLTPFVTSKITGVEVCASSMIFPACSYFFTGSDWVYQLIPVTLEGEAMLDTFDIIP